jgi:transcription elongation factor Elf1
MIKRNPNDFRKHDSCPECGSLNVTEGIGKLQQDFRSIKTCLDCGHEWLDSKARYYTH